MINIIDRQINCDSVALEVRSAEKSIRTKKLTRGRQSHILNRDESLFLLSSAVSHMPEIDEWLSGNPPELYAMARHVFAAFRRCGDDVDELLHDGCPTACVDDAAFGYVNVFKSHVNVGFFMGAFIDDPHSLLEGTGKRMRHVKLKPQSDTDPEAVRELIRSAYTDIKTRLHS